jgi:hypothetical protein
MKIESEELQYIKKTNSLRHNIVNEARSWIGTKFQHQARLKQNSDNQGGCDCLGLIVGIAYKLSINSKNNIPLALIAPSNYPRIPKGDEVIKQLDTHLHQIDISDLRIGDLLLLNIENNPCHLGIVSDYLDGSLAIIHSYFPARSVVEHRLDQKWLDVVHRAYSFGNFLY